MARKIAVKIKKELLIEYLYLDLQTCERCMRADKVLDSAVELLRPVMDAAGFQIEYRKVLIENEELAEKYHFRSSPTILVNGEDIFGQIQENDCGCCSDIAGTDIKCRVFESEGKYYNAPTRSMLVNAILKRVYAFSPEKQDEYVLPENLKRFFEGKREKEKQL